ncbi:MAG: OstA-like protein [Candidatus Kapaibacteriota bacterium]
MNKINLLLFVYIFLFPFVAISQNPIVLVNADSIVGYKMNENPVRDFIGAVHLRQRNIELFCNKATHFIAENRVILIGDVRIVQDTLVLMSDYIEYDGNKSAANSLSKVEIKEPQNYLKANYGTYYFKNKLANFFDEVIYEEKNVKLKAKRVDFDRANDIVYAFNNVKLETDSLILLCDTLVYARTTKNLSAYSNVQTFAKYESLEILSGCMLIDQKNKLSRSFNKPELRLIDTIKVESDTTKYKLDTLFLFADTLISETKDTVTKFKFIHNVKLFKEKITTIGDYGELHRESQWGYLVGSPFLWYDSTEFKGDSLYFVMKNRKISFIEFVNNSSILSPSNYDTLYIHKIQSDTLRIYFSDNKINHILGLGRVKTNYFLKDEETNEIQLANYTSDSIRIHFLDNEVNNVVWYGNVDGEVIPEIIFKKNLSNYYTISKDFLRKKPKLY